MKKFILFLIIIAGIGWFLLNYGLIKTSNKLIFYKKADISLGKNYVNIEKWKAVDIVKNPHISKILLKKGFKDSVDKIKKKVNKKKINKQMKRAKENIDKLIN